MAKAKNYFLLNFLRSECW